MQRKDAVRLPSRLPTSGLHAACKSASLINKYFNQFYSVSISISALPGELDLHFWRDIFFRHPHSHLSLAEYRANKQISNGPSFSHILPFPALFKKYISDFCSVCQPTQWVTLPKYILIKTYSLNRPLCWFVYLLPFYSILSAGCRNTHLICVCIRI